MNKSTIALKPSQIDVSRGFFSTIWQNKEKEVIACNIVVISQANGDQWSPFSWKEYKDRCGHPVSSQEKQILDALVEEGYLNKKNNKYSVNNKFIAALAEYVKD